jgi:hypothetical protein
MRHDPTRHVPPRRRHRWTVAAMMMVIAALSLVLTVSLPLMREGPPPCMTAIGTARWLVSNPGAVQCADCHARPATALLEIRDDEPEDRTVIRPHP